MPTSLAAKSKKADPPRIVATQTAVAEAFGVTSACLSHWTRKPGFPKIVQPDGTTYFDLDAVERWIRARKGHADPRKGKRRPSSTKAGGARPGSPMATEPSDAPKTGTQLSFDELGDIGYRAKVDKEVADARLKTIKADALEGLYIEREIYERDVMGIAAVFRRVLTEQPDRVRADHGDEAAALIDEVVARVWSEIKQARDDAMARNATGDEEE